MKNAPEDECVAAGIVQDGAALISEGFMKILHPENFPLELEDELCSSESSKTMMPLLGGLGVGNR